MFCQLFLFDFIFICGFLLVSPLPVGGAEISCIIIFLSTVSATVETEETRQIAQKTPGWQTLYSSQFLTELTTVNSIV